MGTVTREQSVRRLVLWAVGLVVFTLAMYLPTLRGGYPWSWNFEELDRFVVFLLGGGVFTFASHFWFPTTKRWRELEREAADMLNNLSELDTFRWHSTSIHPPSIGGDFGVRLERLRALVRPHVLKREGR